MSQPLVKSLCTHACTLTATSGCLRNSLSYSARWRLLVWECRRHVVLPGRGNGTEGKVHPRTGHKGPGEYTSTLSLTSALEGDGRSTPRPGRFTSGKDPVPIVQKTGWAPRPVWTGAENLAPTEIRSPDRPARSESLYRLRYPGPEEGMVQNRGKKKMSRVEVTCLHPYCTHFWS